MSVHPALARSRSHRQDAAGALSMSAQVAFFRRAQVHRIASIVIAASLGIPIEWIQNSRVISILERDDA